MKFYRYYVETVQYTLKFIRPHRLLINDNKPNIDKLPAWLLRLGAPVFAAPLAELFNQSINCGIVPQQWKKACITPIPKVAHPTVASDYRPISITSVLSRMLERRIVRTYCTSIQHCNSHHRDSTSPTSTRLGRQDPQMQLSSHCFTPCLPC